MLHGEPPVTVLLYGVQTMDEADDIPDYLLHSVLHGGFVDYDTSDFDLYPELHGQTQQNPESHSRLTQNTKIDSVELTPVLPAPLIYKNGESITTDNSHDIDSTIDKIAARTTDNGLVSNDYNTTSDLTDKIKKVIWKAVPKTEESSDSTPNNFKSMTDTKAATVKPNHKKADNSIKVNQGVTKERPKENIEALNTPRKESLFAKHMKKPKAEPTRPKDKRTEIFSPFVRLQQKKKGSGLGLSLVSQIVTAHQGRIITDTINGHTRFLVIVPVTHDPDYNYHTRQD
jgi:hypothetical protein